jgi:hypothetical protein
MEAFSVAPCNQAAEERHFDSIASLLRIACCFRHTGNWRWLEVGLGHRSLACFVVPPSHLMESIAWRWQFMSLFLLPG